MTGASPCFLHVQPARLGGGKVLRVAKRSLQGHLSLLLSQTHSVHFQIGHADHVLTLPAWQ